MEKEYADIVTKVRELYMKYGIKSVTMDDVARELGISKKTLYECVKDKEELVLKSVNHIMSEIHNSILEIQSRPLNAIDISWEVNRYIMLKMTEYPPSVMYDLRKYYPQIYKMMIDTRRREMYDSIIKIMNQGKEEGLIRDDLNIEIIAKLQLLKIETMTENEIIELKQYQPGELFREIFIYHIRGIASEKGVKYLENKLKSINQ